MVSEPITIIIGAPDLFVNKGSTINLTCVVKYAPEPPPMMIWSHNSEVGIISRDGMVGGRRSRFDSSRIARGQAACLLIRQFVSRFVPFRSKEIRGEYSFRETLKNTFCTPVLLQCENPLGGVRFSMYK